MRQIVPDKNTMERWANEGLTHEQMVERIFELTGERVTRSTVSMAMSRYGLSKAPRQRYREQLPWRVEMQHIKAYPARMLRLLGRREHGLPLGPEQEKRLDTWLSLLAEQDAVVAYDPDSDQGFLYVRREPDDPINPPIRRERVYLYPAH